MKPHPTISTELVSAVFALALAWQPLAGQRNASSVAPPSGGLPSQQARYTFLGDALGYEPIQGGIMIRAEHGAVRIEAIAGIGARMRVRFSDGTPSFPTPHSLATGDSAPRLGSAVVREAGDTVLVYAEGLIVRAARHPLRVSVSDSAGHELLQESFGAGVWQGRLAHVLRDPTGTRYYGLGEQPMPLLRNGSVFPLWNTDRFGYRPGDMPIYSSIPFYLGIRDGVAHGILYDNPFRAEFDFSARMRSSVSYMAEAGIDGGELRYYVIPGPGLDSTLARYTRLTGRTPLPPRWSLGYHQSRYSYFPDTTVENLAREFRRRDIPADVIHLDIHYMNGYRDFTFSPERFPDPKRLLDTLAAKGFKVVTIVDPGLKVDSGYSVYRDGLTRGAYVTLPDGSPYIGIVWPGRSVFPDFSRSSVRDWWGAQHRTLVDVGVRGVWNDMNEPASFGGQTIPDIVQFEGDGHPGTHLEYHNQYGTLMARATFAGFRRLRPERRPFVITRAGYAGLQRYSTIWTGDNNSTWDHLRLSIPMIVGLGLSGIPFAGSDIGGFNGAPSADLYSRWLQAATLVPFMRTHAMIGTPRREPWSYGAEHERANRATIRLRYRMLPALYTAYFQHTQQGSPVVRPVFWNTLTDSAALATDDEYILGDHLLVAPVVDSAAQSRAVYLPAGRWYRLGSGDAYDGGRSVTVQAPDVPNDGGDTTGLRGLPVFARAGAVVPSEAVLSYEGERRLDTLNIDIYPGSATSELYEDAGEGYAFERGEYRRTTFTTSLRPSLSTTLSQTGSYAGVSSFKVTIHDVARRETILVDGRPVRPDYDSARRELHFIVSSRARRLELQ
ncbi:MAG: glycoside hydrolase family 31 protein [Gemmatimonadaceae bacterium]